MAIPDLAGAPVLVTGGAGFIGSHLVDALLARGAAVRVMDNFATGRHENLGYCRERIELVEADLRDPEACRAACEGRRLVFHQAALGSVPRSVEDPVTSLAVNVQGSAHIFDACRRAGVERVVYASSSSVYGDSERLPKVEGEEGAPLSPYAASKVMGEELAAVFARTYGLDSVGLRYFNVYGPRQDPAGPYAAVIPRFFHAFTTGEAPVIHGDGEQRRDFTYVGDAVAANLLAAGADAAGSTVVNVAAGRAATVNELARAIREMTASPVEPVHGPPRAGDVRASLADLTRATALLGYTASTSLAAGLAHTLRHYVAGS
jgi:nucleoside-diphosphate-sugar epimerase